MSLHIRTWRAADVLAVALLALSPLAASAGHWDVNGRPVITVADDGSKEGATWPMPKFPLAKMPPEPVRERAPMNEANIRSPGVRIDTVEPRAGVNMPRR